MTCVYCDEPHVCQTDAGPVCNHHLENPPPTQLDRVEEMLRRLTGGDK